MEEIYKILRDANKLRVGAFMFAPESVNQIRHDSSAMYSGMSKRKHNKTSVNINTSNRMHKNKQTEKPKQKERKIRNCCWMNKNVAQAMPQAE